METNIVGLQPMTSTKMTRFLLLLLCGLFVFNSLANAQKTYFVYLQSDNQHPFYVVLNGKNISSSSIGYVILSKLVDTTYAVKIGFPGTNTLQEYDLRINGNDQGYMIKDFGEKGWGLFNLQSLVVEMSSNKANKAKAEEAVVRAEAEKNTADSLAQVQMQLAATHKADSMAAASTMAEKIKSDSLALVSGVVVEPTVTPDETKTGNEGKTPVAVEKTKTGTVEKPEEVTTAGEKDDQKKVVDSTISVAIKPVKDSVATDAVLSAKKVDTVKATPGNDSINVGKVVTTPAYVDANSTFGSVADTLVSEKAVSLPLEKTRSSTGADSGKGPKFLDMEIGADTTGLVTTHNKEKKIDHISAEIAIVENTSDTTLKAPPVVSAETTKKKPVAGLTSNNSNTTIVTIPVDPVASTKAAPVSDVLVAGSGATANASSGGVITNSACKQTASDKDFFNLRKKMVSTNEAPEMVLIAKKSFKEKCFSAAQVRNLCVLFLDDASRYNFLDQVYDYTYDRENFKLLSDLLKDAYYIRRFNAMLK